MSQKSLDLAKLSTEERIDLHLETMKMMLCGDIDWDKGYAIRRHLNVTSKEIKEQLLKEINQTY